MRGEEKKNEGCPANWVWRSRKKWRKMKRPKSKMKREMKRSRLVVVMTELCGKNGGVRNGRTEGT